MVIMSWYKIANQGSVELTERIRAMLIESLGSEQGQAAFEQMNDADFAQLADEMRSNGIDAVQNGKSITTTSTGSEEFNKIDNFFKNIANSNFGKKVKKWHDLTGDMITNYDPRNVKSI